MLEDEEMLRRVLEAPVKSSFSSCITLVEFDRAPVTSHPTPVFWGVGGAHAAGAFATL